MCHVSCWNQRWLSPTCFFTYSCKVRWVLNSHFFARISEDMNRDQKCIEVTNVARLFPIFMATKLISWDASPSQVIPLYLIAFPKQFGRSAGSSPDQRLMSEWYLSVWPKNANQASVQARSLWFYGFFGSWKTWRLVEFYVFLQIMP